jgi:dephospho-CoA kinase
MSVVFANKPIIGIAGGIGSGKSFVAGLFGELGCVVLSADEHVREVYRDPAVQQTLKSWWGEGVFNRDGELDRRAVARIVFERPEEKRRLEALVHPRVAELRRAAMRAAANDTQVLAFVWDIPLLFEAGLNAECDAVVFVEASRAARLGGVEGARGWDDSELLRREKLQHPLDIKRQMSNYIVQNTADVGFARRQVREVLSEILANCAMIAPSKSDDPSRRTHGL